jgi:transposase
VQWATLRSKHAALRAVFTERSRRLWAASEARALGHGGIALVERATGISRSTIQRGLRELERTTQLPPDRTRHVGGGRKRTPATDPTLLRDLDALVEPTAPGDPDSPLRWSCKSTRTLAVALQALGHSVSHTVVAELLHELGYSLQGNVKTREGRQHPDRDAQFRYIAETVTRAQRRGHPAISVDTNYDPYPIMGTVADAGCVRGVQTDSLPLT